MKRNLLFVGAILGLFTLASCGSDDGPSIPPIVGEWELDDITVTDVPAAFNRFEGTEIPDIFGESDYTIEFLADFTYERELSNVPTNLGSIDLEDEGTWELDGTDLELDQEDRVDDLVTEFEIDGEITDRDLVLVGEYTFIAIPDAVLSDPGLDTVPEADLDSVLGTFFQQFSTTLRLEFEKQ